MTETSPAVEAVTQEQFCERCGSVPCGCCPRCKGHGTIEGRAHFSEKDDEEFFDEVTCPRCGGSGVEE